MEQILKTLTPILIVVPRRTASVNHHDRRPNPKPKPKPTIKLPHILSESSEASYSPHKSREHDYSYNNNNNDLDSYNYTYNAQANYASTLSQASSVWNWENFYLPSPPDSKYFNRRQPNFESEDDKSSIYSDYNQHKNHRENHSEINEDKCSAYSQKNHHPKIHTRQQQESEEEDDEYNSHHLESEDTEDDNERDEIVEIEEREEVQCSAWDHYSTTSSTSDDEEIDRDSRSEMESRSNFGSSVHNQSVAPPLSVFNSVPKLKFDTIRVIWGFKRGKEMGRLKDINAFMWAPCDYN